MGERTSKREDVLKKWDKLPDAPSMLATYAETVATETPEWVAPADDADALLVGFESRIIDMTVDAKPYPTAERAAVRARMRPWPTAELREVDALIQEAMNERGDFMTNTLKRARAALAALGGCK